MPADTAAGLKPPITISEYMAFHRVSRARVRKWMDQGRLPYERRGGGEGRAGVVLILTVDRPDRLPPGSLSPEQRAAWGKRRAG